MSKALALPSLLSITEGVILEANEIETLAGATSYMT